MTAVRHERVHKSQLHCIVQSKEKNYDCNVLAKLVCAPTIGYVYRWIWL